MDQPNSITCPRCGAPIPAGAPGQPCPACLLSGAVAAPGGPAAPREPADFPREIGGYRLLGWLGESIARDDLMIDMEVQVVPRVFEEIEPIKVYYTIEKAGSSWSKAPAGTPAGRSIVKGA